MGISRKGFMGAVEADPPIKQEIYFFVKEERGTNMYEDRVLAYIDILGFSEVVESKSVRKDGTEDEDETENICTLLEDMQNQHIPIENEVVNYFSDSVIISYPKIEEAGVIRILFSILFRCAAVLKKGFLLRGAVVSGKLYHKETKIFGPALVKAYKMENKLAIYPRIILDEDILGIAKKYPARMISPQKQSKIINDKILKDFDGIHFLNYLDLARADIVDQDTSLPEYLESLKKILKELESKKENDLSIKSKYLWLKQKTDDVFKKYKRYYHNDKGKREYPKLYEYIDNFVNSEAKSINVKGD